MSPVSATRSANVTHNYAHTSSRNEHSKTTTPNLRKFLQEFVSIINVPKLLLILAGVILEIPVRWGSNNEMDFLISRQTRELPGIPQENLVLILQDFRATFPSQKMSRNFLFDCRLSASVLRSVQFNSPFLRFYCP